jgi:DNA-binding beta-propeller fold protein YncE
MSSHPKLALIAGAFASVVLAAYDAQGAKPPLCTAGRFAVEGSPLIGPGGEIIVFGDRSVALGTLCNTFHARVKRTKLGTKVRVKFPKDGCTGVEGKVKLAFLISDECTQVTGTIKPGQGASPSEFTAAVSTCGDDVVDTGAGEECEAQADCSAGEDCNATCACVAVGGTLSRPSRSSTITISDDETLVAMVNPDDDSISVFQTANDTRLSKVPTGDEPSSIVIAPDSTTAYVANRADGTVVKVTGIDTATPTVGTPLGVGSEPTGLALSPSGATLFVAELAEGRVTVINTAPFTIAGTIDGPVNPRTIAVTNDGDTDDADELLIVPEFFGEPTAGGEGKDDGRTGRVRIYQLSDLTPGTPILFAPLDSGFTVMTSPNQLWAMALRSNRIYVTSVSAPPATPLQFDRNVFAVVYVGDLDARAPVNDPGGTTNLTKAVVDQVATRPRFVVGDVSDMDFIPNSNVSYVVSRGADVVQRVTWNDGVSIDLGSAANDQINVLGNQTIGLCQGPTGIALKSDATRAYLNCWVSQTLGVIDLTAQALTKAVESSPPPGDALGQSVQRGKRFYHTGRGRWSNAGGSGPGGVGVGGNGAVGGEGWSSCASCHPDGLTDNITWVFGTGPRQTVSQDGSFSHGPGIQKQKIFNHTGIFDEHHDFEGNTRGVSGGLGAITSAAQLADCSNLTLETQVALQAGLGPPMKDIADDPGQALCQHKDWDDIDNFVKTIRPPRSIRSAPTDSVTRGRTLFETQGQCHKCHASGGWTLSRRFFTPSAVTNATLAVTDFTKPVAWPATWTYTPRTLISNQPAIVGDGTGPAEAAPIGGAQVACVLRNVGTFGVPGDAPATDALELKANATRAQGRGGYNIPSLYGLALGAPYLHHGQALTLDDLFSSSAYDFHTNAGAANFSVTLAANPQNVVDLVNFLLSIDADTAELSPPAGFEGCP